LKLAVVILAAGYSSRMGAFKPLLPVGGQSAVVRAVLTAEQAGVGHVSVVTGHRDAEVAAELRRERPDAHIVFNARHSEGMMTSVLAGALALPADTDAFFLLPVDCCAVRADTLEKIASAARNGDADVTCPVYGGRTGHPPLIRARVMESAGEFRGEGGMRAYLAKFSRACVDVDDSGVAADMDTPGDYAAMLRMLGLPTYPREEDALRLLHARAASPEVAEHCRAVAGVAVRIAREAIAGGANIDTALLRSACLLHDICRGEPNHARAGELLLLSLGFPDAAIAVGAHMELPEGHDAIDETAILYLADKLCRRGGETPLETTLAAALVRYEGRPEAANAARGRIERAMSIERALRERYGVQPRAGGSRGSPRL
jgi:CTP:molybdopterin cytidylyltransferase MocA